MEITSHARRQLSTDLRQMQSSLIEQACFRIVESRAEGLTLVLSRPQPDDVIFAHDDRVVLAVGPDIAPHLQNRTLDIEVEGDGTKNLMLIPSPRPEGEAGAAESVDA